MINKLAELYKELNEFVKTKNFQVYGFSKTGKNHGWLWEIRNIQKKGTREEKQLAGEIIMLSVHYTLESKIKIIVDLREIIETDLGL